MKGHIRRWITLRAVVTVGIRVVAVADNPGNVIAVYPKICGTTPDACVAKLVEAIIAPPLVGGTKQGLCARKSVIYVY